MSATETNRWLYLDSSCLPPYFTPETGSARADSFFGSPHKSSRIALSYWTITEFHSAIAQKVRSGVMSSAQQVTVLEAFAAFALRLECWSLQASDFTDASQLLNHYKLGLRAGDALHLAVARRQRATLVTLDGAQLAAAKHYRIPGITF